jgi:cellobiose phosphorylase
MESVYQELADHDKEILLLLKPPFNKTPRSPGYIKGYPPGIRENGGQYTHAALWAIWAFAELGQADRAHELFRMINPVLHVETRDEANKYRVEPFVIAADVYSTPPHAGRGGWTWYTGSASWMYRLGTERLLGICRFADHLEIRPSIPKDWSGYQINYRLGKSMYHIRVENRNGASDDVNEINMDGIKLPDLKIPLRDDGQVHEIVVMMK